VSSRRLGQRCGRRASGSWWTTGGSRRLLPTQQAVEGAVRYVLNQPSPLAVFEHELPEQKQTQSPDIHVGHGSPEDTHVGDNDPSDGNLSE
ncbi:MAG: hypothetical protein IID40_03130, partial [Planctomycetes bacterium]|nr:hypothetical protein [Planctomycetota bacterium]